MSLTTKTQNTVGAVGRYPTDLAFVTLATVLAYVLVTNLPPGSGLRLLSALTFVSFLPGYALVSMLFPVRARARAPGPQATAEARPGGIDAVERLALGLGLSIAVVPIVVLALPLTRWGLTVGSTVGALAVVTVVAAQLAVIRRLRVPPADRFTVSLADLRSRFSSANETGAARASSLLLGLAVIAAVGVLLYSFTAPMAAGVHPAGHLHGRGRRRPRGRDARHGRPRGLDPDHLPDPQRGGPGDGVHRGDARAGGR
ncbi:DUF1616 domain-containing protein [Saliphagus sp. GCM10025308]